MTAAPETLTPDASWRLDQGLVGVAEQHVSDRRGRGKDGSPARFRRSSTGQGGGVGERPRREPGSGGEWPAGLAPLVSTEPLKGGFICSTVRGRLADGREVVVKRCPYAAEVEADGLQALAAAGVPVPAVLGVAGQALVLERVGGPPDWAGLGRAIAGLHRTTGDRFGWHRDNFQGITVQPNGWSDDWPSFYVAHRVRPHLGDPRVPEPLRRRIERACEGPLPALLRPRPPPSLTHGDLWVAT